MTPHNGPKLTVVGHPSLLEIIEQVKSITMTGSENPYSKIYKNIRTKVVVEGAEKRSETEQINQLIFQSKRQQNISWQN